MFTFDGETWRQVEPVEPPYGQEFVLSERTFRDWGESNVLEDESGVLAGGELFCSAEFENANRADPGSTKAVAVIHFFEIKFY